MENLAKTCAAGTTATPPTYSGTHDLSHGAPLPDKRPQDQVRSRKTLGMETYVSSPDAFTSIKREATGSAIRPSRRGSLRCVGATSRVASCCHIVALYDSSIAAVVLEWMVADRLASNNTVVHSRMSRWKTLTSSTHSGVAKSRPTSVPLRHHSRDGLIHTTYSVHSDHSYEVVRFLGYFEFIAAENYRIP